MDETCALVTKLHALGIAYTALYTATLTRFQPLSRNYS